MKMRKRGEIFAGRDKETELCRLATDVEAPFPSLCAEETGRHCRLMLEKSGMNLKGIIVRVLLPKRKEGLKIPKMTSNHVKGPTLTGGKSVEDSKWEQITPQQTKIWLGSGWSGHPNWH